MNNYQLSINNYPLYKDSGVEWLGNVPEHWQVKRIKDLSFLQSGNNVTSEQIEEIEKYPVYGGNGLRGYFSRYTNEGDYILIGRQGALCGNINYASGKFWATEHAVVVYLKSLINIKWYGEILRVLNLNQYSLSAAQPGLAVDRIKRLLLPVPPFSEQKAIAHYLDTKTAQIDRKIDLLSQKAKLHSNLKQSLINETVTRGLDKSVPMKNSGIEWIGEVPDHWGKRRLKDIYTYTKGYAFKSDEFIDFGTPIVKATDIKQYRILESTSFINSSRIESYKNVLLKDNDIVISTVGSQPNIIDSAVGQLARIDKKIAGSLLNQNTVILRINKKEIDNKFLYYNLISKSFRQHLDIIARGTANQSSIKVSETLEYRLFLPTSQEQKAIADYLDTKTAQI